MVQNFTKDQCVMIMDQIDDVIIDPLKENISITKFAVVDDSKKSNLPANLMKLIENLN